MRSANDRPGFAPGAVIDLPGLSPGFDAAAAADVVAAARHDEFNRVVGEIHGGQTRWRRDEQHVSCGRVRILVKVEAGASRLTRKAHYPMTSPRLNPLARRLGKSAKHEEKLQSESNL